MRATFAAGTWGFETGDVSFHGAWPEAAITRGADGAPTLARPHGRPVAETGSRMTPAGAATEESWRWKIEDDWELSWTLCGLDALPGFTVRSSIRNLGTGPLRLGAFWLARSPEGALSCVGEAAGWWLQTVSFSRRNGNLSQLLRSVAELAASPERVAVGQFAHETTGDRTRDGRWRVFEDVITLYSASGRRGVTMAAVGPAQSYVFFDCRVDGGRVRVEISSEMDDVRVDPGESRESEEVLVLALPYRDAMERAYRWIAATHGARTARAPISGWCHWYDRAQHIDAAHVIAVAEASAGLRDRAPLEVIQIDDGWQREYGDWRPDPAKFPEGLEPVARAIRAAGAIPGIWMSPAFTKCDLPPGWGQDRGLDVSSAGAREAIRSAIAARVTEGFRYFKLDYNFHLSPPLGDPKMTRFQAMRELFRLYREAVGEDSFLLACVGRVLRAAVGFADGMRTGPDAVPRWSGPLAADGLPRAGGCVIETIRALGSAAAANGILFSTDPDLTYLPEPQIETWPKTLTQGELRTWHSFVGLLGGSVMVCEPLNHPVFSSPESLRFLEIALPQTPEKGCSFLGAVDPFHRQFGFVARRPWGTFASVVLYNPKDHAADAALGEEGLEELGGPVHVWSFWDEAYLGIHRCGTFARRLEPHACALLRLTPLGAGAVPVVVGSSLHLGMGAAEIRKIASDASGLAIVLSDAGARSGGLWVHSGAPLEVLEERGCRASVSRDGTDLWRLDVVDRVRGTENRVRLRAR